ncbi:retrovirus-related pol polyprotein from transposon TNT 1-94 [Tanacetum coccineum]
MSFFLGSQISQNLRGIFINQSKYALEIIKKYDMESSDSIDTPMVDKTKLDEGLQGTPVDPTRYHGIDDDEVPTKEVSPELLVEVFEKEMTYDDIQIIYMENENVCESREEDLTEKIPKKPVLVYLSCAINPKIPPISLVNQDLFYLKWVKNTIKGFNLYARYVVDHWKSLWAQQDHIRRKQKKRDNPDKLHSDVKIAEVFAESDYMYLHKNDIEDVPDVH